jgi:uncharacterized membrane protein YedE/YeeE
MITATAVGLLGGGPWRPNLLLVMLGATSVHLVSYRVIRHRSSPLLRDVFHLPARGDLDRTLVVGAVVFGVGWGLVGVCPGSALVGMLAGAPTLLFVAALVVGMVLHDRTALGTWARGRPPGRSRW